MVQGNWDSNGTFENAFSKEYQNFLAFTVEATRKGINATIRLLSIDGAEVVINPDIPLRPIRMLRVYVAVSTPEMVGSTDTELRADQVGALDAGTTAAPAPAPACCSARSQL